MALEPLCRGLLVPVLVATCLLLPWRSAAAPGDFDLTFDGDGIVMTNLGSEAAASDVAIQDDGRIVAVGWQGGEPSVFTVVRFEIDGSLDLSFGSGGVATADLGTGSASAVVIDPDGRIVVAGRAANGDTDSSFAIVRFDAAGALDAGFGTGGITRTDIPAGTDDEAHALVRLADGRLVVGGGTWIWEADPHESGVLACYDDAGQLDPGFGDGGIVVTTDLHPVLDVVATGDLLLATGAADRLTLARYRFDGTPAGTGQGPAGAVSYGAAIAVDRHGRAVVVGGTDRYYGRTLIAQFAGDGTLDPGFGDGGLVRPAGLSTLDYDGGTAVALQPDGRILLTMDRWVYETPPVSFTYHTWSLVRLDPDGELDPTFADGGVKALGIGSGFPAALAMQDDGQVITAGYEDYYLIEFPYYTIHSSLVLRRNEAMAPTLCAAAPRTDCAAPAAPGKSMLTLTREAGEMPTLRWLWKGAISVDQLGDPTAGDSYAWCVYDAEEALVTDARLEGGGICGDRPCWKAAGASGFQYRNLRGTWWGIDKMSIKGGSGVQRLRLQGRHWNVPFLALPAVLPLRVQAVSPGGDCFEAVYSVAARNDDEALLSARSD